MKIEAGKYYRTRDGQKIGPMRRNDIGVYTDTHPWRGGSIRGADCYRNDGMYDVGAIEDMADLIAEWSEPMTPQDYNDGLWHGWNGGECPVDPETEIQAVRGTSRDSTVVTYSTVVTSRAKDFQKNNWTEDGRTYSIIAFRVTKPAPPKPRTIWMLETPSGGRNVYVTRAAADHDARVYGGAIITEWTEVLP